MRSEKSEMRGSERHERHERHERNGWQSKRPGERRGPEYCLDFTAH